MRTTLRSTSSILSDIHLARHCRGDPKIVGPKPFECDASVLQDTKLKSDKLERQNECLHRVDAKRRTHNGSAPGKP
jgi:hypothetical protein